MRRALTGLLVLALVGSPQPAVAEPEIEPVDARDEPVAASKPFDAAPAATTAADENPRAASEPSPIATGPVSTLAALLPINGSGLYVAGDRRGARWLVTSEALGLAALLAGGIPLAATGASRRVSLPAIPLLVSGAGVMLIGYVVDVAASAGLARLAAAPPQGVDALAIAAGYAFVDDPQFDYQSFATFHAELWWRRLVARPSLWVATGADNQRLRLELGGRIRGPSADHATAGPLTLDGFGAVSWQHFGQERFAVTTVEAALHTRLELGSAAALLHGMFAELDFGLGLAISDYAGVDASPDVDSLLLGGFGVGVHLPHGLLRMYYRHRRDNYPGGFATPSNGNGFLGYFGGEVEHRLGDWAVLAGFDAGSAYVARIALGVRWASL